MNFLTDRPSPFIERQNKVYCSYHRNPTNIALHIVGIPDIMLSLFILTWVLISAGENVIDCVNVSVSVVLLLFAAYQAFRGCTFRKLALLIAIFLLNLYLLNTGALLVLGLIGLMGYHLFWGGKRGMVVALLGTGFIVLAITPFFYGWFSAWVFLEGIIFITLTAFGCLNGYAVNAKKKKQAWIFMALTTVGLFTYLAGTLSGAIRLPHDNALFTGLVLFGAGFWYHIPGHAFFEGNRPAFTRDVPSALFGAPQELVRLIFKI